MGARDKLNQHYLYGAIGLASLAGLLTGSHDWQNTTIDATLRHSGVV